MMNIISLDRENWRFKRRDIRWEKAASPELDDGIWEKVTLPHTAKLEPTVCNDPWEGICWYRLKLNIPQDWAEKILHLEFGGAMQKADIYLNGKYYFTHEGGYQRFLVPLTGMVKVGEENLLAIRLDNRPSDNCPPGKPVKNLDFLYYSGLYRSVRLIVNEKIHITDPLEVCIEGGGGVFLRTLQATKEQAKLSCRVHVMHTIFPNECWTLPQKADIPVPCQLDVELLAPDSSPATEPVSLEASIRPNMDYTYETEFTVKNPLLWSPDSPHLYTARFTLKREGEVLETKLVRYGIRTIGFDRKLGWLINGERTPILGTNRHQDYPQIGNAVPATLQRRDAMVIKRAGYNLVRLAHYPQDPAFLDACDELGLCVIAPIAGWQHWSRNTTFINNVLRDCRELVRNERNRPCVVLWEVSLNESYPNAWLQEEMHRTAHREYPGDQCFTCGDVYGLFEGWDVLFNRTNLNNREKAVIVREYGDWAFGGLEESTSRHTRRDGDYELLRQTWNYQWTLNRMPMEDGYIGGCTWCMFDCATAIINRLTECGDCDEYRYPKYKYHFFRSQGSKEPMVFLATRREYLDKVVVFSNCEEVEIFLNGVSVAKQKPDGGESTSYHTTGNPNWETVLRPWELDGKDVALYDGGNCENLAHPPFTFFDLPRDSGELKAVGYIGGKAVAEDIVRTAERPVGLTVQLRHEGVALVEDDIVVVDVMLVDQNGTVVTDNTGKVTLLAEGNARVIGETKRTLSAGIVSFLLKVEKPNGFTLRARCKNFSEGELTV